MSERRPHPIRAWTAALGAAVLAAVTAGGSVPVAGTATPSAWPTGLVQSHRHLQAAEAALEAGRLEQALRRLEAAGVPDGERSYRAVRLHLLRARLALALQQPADAVRWAQRARELADDEDAVEAGLVLAAGLEARGQRAEAFRALLEAGRSRWLTYHGRTAEQLLDQMARLARGLPASSQPTPEELLHYGRLLYRFGRWQQGVELFSRPGWGRLEPEATAELARGLAALGRDERLQALLQRALPAGSRQAWPASVLASLEVRLAELLDRQGGAQQAQAQWQRLLEAYPGTHAAGQALAALTRKALESGDLSKADGLLQALGDRALGTAGWAEAHWALFAAAYAAAATGGDPSAPAVARRALARLQAGGVRDATFLYWAARLQHEHPAPAHAPGGPPFAPPDPAGLVAELLHRHPLAYYSVLARDRWPEVAEGGQWQVAAAGPPDPGTARGALEALEALRGAGMTREAARELGYLVEQQQDPELVALLARWEQAVGHFGPSVGRLASSLPGEPLAGLQGWLLEGLFPVAYGNVVEPGAQEEGVDPYLVLAVMREESTFEPEALSSAGARGLMQLLPSTASWLAERKGVPGVEPAGLYDPVINVRLGTALLRYLLDRYPDVRIAVAAYHAGPGRVDRWLQRFGPDDPELFVERIPISATREYVRRVYRSYRIYRLLYEGPADVARAEEAGPAAGRRPHL